MKKVLLSIAALFTVATYASAQETGFGFGPKVGINLSNQTLLDGDYKTGLTTVSATCSPCRQTYSTRVREPKAKASK